MGRVTWKEVQYSGQGTLISIASYSKKEPDNLHKHRVYRCRKLKWAKLNYIQIILQSKSDKEINVVHKKSSMLAVETVAIKG